ncbi:MAG: RecX family transcriptional regulator [Chitinophagaceae bacterium]|nr:RecX family transcriptional regulator [Chitinophagaceae bacterium]
MNGLTKEESLPKIKQFCAYQERCHFEVRVKLYSYRLHKMQVEEILSILIEENYLNEERFALLYAGGKFRMKHWGKVKIKYALKQKQVSEYCIKKALKEINEDEYKRTITKLGEQKLKTLKGEKYMLIKKKKLRDHLLQKGYESTLISEVIKNIIN